MRDIIRFCSIVRASFWLTRGALSLWLIGAGLLFSASFLSLMGLVCIIAGTTPTWEIFGGAGFIALIACIAVAYSWSSQRLLFDLMLNQLLRYSINRSPHTIEFPALRMKIVVGRQFGPELFYSESGIRVEEGELSTAFLYEILLHATVAKSDLAAVRLATLSRNAHCPNVSRLGVR